MESQRAAYIIGILLLIVAYVINVINHEFSIIAGLFIFLGILLIVNTYFRSR
jgi:disulfide bond formation protein DsbB